MRLLLLARRACTPHQAELPPLLSERLLSCLRAKPVMKQGTEQHEQTLELSNQLPLYIPARAPLAGSICFGAILLTGLDSTVSSIQETWQF